MGKAAKRVYPHVAKVALETAGFKVEWNGKGTMYGSKNGFRYRFYVRAGVINFDTVCYAIGREQ